MFRTPVLLLQMHEGSGQLYETLEKLVGRSMSLEPEMLQHVVGLVVLLLIEAYEVADITWVVLRPCAQRLNVRLDSFAFFHSRSSWICLSVCLAQREFRAVGKSARADYGKCRLN